MKFDGVFAHQSISWNLLPMSGRGVQWMPQCPYMSTWWEYLTRTTLCYWGEHFHLCLICS